MSNATENGLPPAGWYRDPNAAGLERWWDGVIWTAHSRATDAASGNVTRQSAASQACPSCGASDAKSLKVVHDQGTTTGSAATTGWAQGTGGQPGYAATFSTTMKSSTDAARKAAAPRKRFNGVALIAIGVILAGALGVIGYSLGVNGVVGSPTFNIAVAVVIGLITMIGGVALAIHDSAYNHGIYPDVYEQWTHSWQCQRCGTVFLI